MKKRHVLILLLFPLYLFGQSRPTYCDELPTMYEKAVMPKGIQGPKLPSFPTQAFSEYKVQVAILRHTEPTAHPFHSSLVARYRPCEEVWVVESRESFTDKSKAEKLKKELIALGYRDAYITELIGFK